MRINAPIPLIIVIEMAVLETNKKLSYKRFIPMVVLMATGGFFIVTGKADADIFKYGIDVFDYQFRSEIIYFITIVVGFFHYYNITRDEQESKNIFINTSFGFIDSIGSAVGYGLIIDKGMNVASGLLKEIYGLQQFFNDAASVDYFSIGSVVIAVIVIGTVKIYQMGKESVFEITHSFKDVNTTTENNPTPKKKSNGKKK
jgi:hypothetical protein